MTQSIEVIGLEKQGKNYSLQQRLFLQSKPKPKQNKSEVDQAKIDAILDKISQSGYTSLTKEEKELLFRAGKS